MKKYFSYLTLLCAALYATSCPAATTRPDAVLDNFTAANDVVGTGRIISLRLAGPNKWLIVTESTETFLGEKTPDRIEINLTTGRGGQWLYPGNDWVGKDVLFLVSKHESTYFVPRTSLTLSPNGSPFFIWKETSPAEVAEVANIKRVSRLFYLNATELRKQLINAVIDDSIPEFLKSMAMEEISLRGENDKTLRSLNAQQFLSWRDLPKLSIGVRLTADFFTILNSPPAYSIDSKRIEFLTNITTSKEASEKEKRLAQWRLDQVQQGKTKR